MKKTIGAYASPPIWKVYPCNDIISKLYKPVFHDSYLSHNMSYVLQVHSSLSPFCRLPPQYELHLTVLSDFQVCYCF